MDQAGRLVRVFGGAVASDFIYLDAGTTTGFMIDHITEKSAMIVTNAVVHARRLAARGFHVFLIGGELKSSTEAVVGIQAINTLRTYHFTKGFFGTNGVSRGEGLTTPDANEALIKQAALEQCRKRYILCDCSKFDSVSSVTFGNMDDVTILTESCPEHYKDCQNIIITS